MESAVQTPTDSHTEFRQASSPPGGSGRDPVPERLVSLDAFRGFIMTALAAGGFGLRVFHDDPQLGWLGRQFEHVAWEGMVFWDLIQPAFMFMVGLAMPFAFAARARRNDTGSLWVHVVYRALMLIVISQVIMSISRGEAHFQLINVLSQIGLAYLCAWGVMQLPFRGQAAAATLILAGHTALFLLLPGSDGAWSQADNVGARIDHFLGLEYGGYYVTINFVSSTVTTLLGVWCGYVMIEKQSHTRRMAILAAAVAGCWAGGLAVSMLVPSVKRIWTAPFTLLSGGWVILILLGFYWAVEVKGWRKATFPLVVVGMNSIFIYCMNVVLHGWLDRAVGTFTGSYEFLGRWGEVAQATSIYLVLWWLCWQLYRRRIFLKV